MEKKLKAMAARAASPACVVPGPGAVRCHWLVRKQKPTNHKNDQSPTGGQASGSKALHQRIRPNHAGNGNLHAGRPRPPPGKALTFSGSTHLSQDPLSLAPPRPGPPL